MKKIGNKSALLTALESLNDNVQREDEFTLKEFIQEASKDGRKLPENTAASHLRRLIELGELKSRKICLNGKISNVYSKP
jgi:hypothetical protein